MASLYETAARLHDPRVKGRSKHLPADIVILAVLAVTSGAEGYEAIEEFGKYHYQTLRKRLRLPNGIPSHDTINRVFQAIKFRQFERLFLEWTEGLKPEGSAEHVIAIDGNVVFAPLSETHAFAAFQIDCRKDYHLRSCLSKRGRLSRGDPSPRPDGARGRRT